jgi:hypothetical protein
MNPTLAKAWKVTIKVAYSFYAILKGEGWNNEDNNPEACSWIWMFWNSFILLVSR